MLRIFMFRESIGKITDVDPAGLAARSCASGAGNMTNIGPSIHCAQYFIGRQIGCTVADVASGEYLNLVHGLMSEGINADSLECRHHGQGDLVST